MLTDTKNPSAGADAFANGLKVGMMWTVSKKAMHLEYEPQLGRGTVGFPVVDGRRGDVESLGYVALSQPEIKTSLAQVVSKGLLLTRVGR